MINQKHKDFATTASPINWYEVAKLLHENAQELFNSSTGYITYVKGNYTKTRTTVNRSVFLLSAFALENLIKAYLIYENPSFIEGGKLSKEIRSHKLSHLQKKCKKIPSPIRTLHIFETLEIGVNSWARYPCSLSFEGEKEERTVTPEFWKAYEQVFKLYSSRLEVLLAKNHKGAYGELQRVTFS